MLHETVVEEGTLALIRKLSADNIFSNFHLVGGTALALQLGHRKSVDIDLFSGQPFDTQKISDHLQNKYSAQELQAINNAIFCYINDVKVDLICHQYNWLHPPAELDGIRLASPDDIAAMKIHAIVQSGSRLKDFVDIFFLLEQRSMDQVMSAYLRKYPEGNLAIAQMALFYHNDVQLKTAVDIINRDLKWSEIARRLREATFNPERIFLAPQLNKDRSRKH